MTRNDANTPPYVHIAPALRGLDIAVRRVSERDHLIA